MANLKIASINVRGLYDNTKRNNFYNWVTHQKIDICLIQKTFCTSTCVPFFNAVWNGKIYQATTDLCHSRGVFIIFVKNVNFTLINQHRSEDGRKLILNGSIDDNSVTLVCYMLLIICRKDSIFLMVKIIGLKRI